jgi:asparagine synthase (glutamine-hydrolysing)
MDPTPVLTWIGPRADVGHETDAALAVRIAAGPADALSSLRGPFALAVRHGTRTILAVDRFAIRTLCYRLDANGAAQWAERADDLAGDDDPLDDQAIFDYLFFHAIPSPRTIFAAVRRLPPSHFAIVQTGSIAVQPYWVPEFRADEHPDFDSLKGTFLDLLQASVRRALGTGRPACFLSGGTDSSTVAGMLSRIGETPPATFSIGFDAAGYDEMSYARLAARHYRTEHHEYYVTPADLVSSIGDVARHWDQPFGNSSAVPAFHCARLAKEHGVERLLAGDGGDELFGGNARYAKQRVFDAYAFLPRPLRSRVIEPLVLRTPLQRLPLSRKAAS